MMKTIELDDNIYDYLLSKAIQYEDKTPNDTLRRLFGLDKKEIPARSTTSLQTRARKVEGRKNPKANLTELVKAGVLEEGQVLHMRDYQGREIPDSDAMVHQGGLLKEGLKYSMSNLAKKLLKNQGYTSNSVRGPSHWYTIDNLSVRRLWGNYLKKIA
jgi:hypothetical protein